MKNLLIIKNGEMKEITAIKLKDENVLDAMTRKYDTKYEARDFDGKVYVVYEHKGYCSYGYHYDEV